MKPTDICRIQDECDDIYTTLCVETCWLQYLVSIPGFPSGNKSTGEVPDDEAGDGCDENGHNEGGLRHLRRGSIFCRLKFKLVTCTCALIRSHASKNCISTSLKPSVPWLFGSENTITQIRLQQWEAISYLEVTRSTATTQRFQRKKEQWYARKPKEDVYTKTHLLLSADTRVYRCPHWSENSFT